MDLPKQLESTAGLYIHKKKWMRSAFKRVSPDHKIVSANIIAQWTGDGKYTDIFSAEE